ncbi:hypothetical protein GCM10009609_60330 [Pseudonocardia aurantiaca]
MVRLCPVPTGSERLSVGPPWAAPRGRRGGAGGAGSSLDLVAVSTCCEEITARRTSPLFERRRVRVEPEGPSAMRPEQRHGSRKLRADLRHSSTLQHL